MHELIKKTMLEKIKKMYPAGTWVYSASGYRGKPQRMSGHKYKFSNIYLGYTYADDKILL